jgi:hypothetical protein
MVARSFRAIGLATPLIFALPEVALAGAHLNSIWLVEPSENTSEARTIAPGEMLVTTRLIPPALVVLEDTVIDPNNSSFPIPAGTQLFGTLDGSIWQPKLSAKPVFCEIKGFVAEPGRRSRGDIVVRRCLLDSNSDGAFDGIFSINSCLAEFPNIANFDLPKKMSTVSARFKQLKPSDISDGPRVGIVFDGFNYMNGGPRFFRAFGNGSPIPAFGRLSQKKAKDGLQELFGARFAILDQGTDRAKVKVELRQGIPTQTFAMLGGGLCF